MRLCLFFLLFLVNTYAFIVSYNYNFPRRDTTVLFGKGSRKSNNKAKKKKTITSEDSSSSSSSISNTPARIMSGTGLSVRKQIALAKAYKKATDASTHSIGKKFRQERGEKKEEEEYVEINYEKTKPPAIFVDGYNIVNYINCVEANGLRGERLGLDIADGRDSLISDLCVLRGCTGWYIEVVFDSYKKTSNIGGGIPGNAVSSLIDNVRVTFSGKSETADTYIERRFNDLKKEGFTNMVVATDDKILRMAAGGVGAGFLSCGMLVEEMKFAYSSWAIVEEELKTEEIRSRPRLGDLVSTEVQAAVQEMKDREKEVLAEKILKAEIDAAEEEIAKRKQQEEQEEKYKQLQEQLKAFEEWEKENNPKGNFHEVNSNHNRGNENKNDGENDKEIRSMTKDSFDSLSKKAYSGEIKRKKEKHKTYRGEDKEKIQGREKKKWGSSKAGDRGKHQKQKPIKVAVSTDGDDEKFKTTVAVGGDVMKAMEELQRLERMRKEGFKS